NVLFAAPERFLGLDLFRYVCVGTEPTDDIASVVADRQSARQKPPIGAVLAPERKRVLPGRAGFEALSHALDDTIHMLGMVHFLPSPPLHLFERRPGVVVPALVEPISPALSVRRPGELTDVVGKFAKTRLAFAQRRLRFDLLRDIRVGAEP